jgi:hypothetical protein
MFNAADETTPPAPPPPLKFHPPGPPPATNKNSIGMVSKGHAVACNACIVSLERQMPMAALVLVPAAETDKTEPLYLVDMVKK